jgi:hypothetical protein
MEPAMITEPKRRTQKRSTRETESRSAAPPRSSRRKPAQFSVPIKLWVSQEMYDALTDAARERDWSVPQVIRRVVKNAIGERKLG